jgi:hypothetical protein
MQPMDHQNDPLWKMGQQAQEQQMQRAQQIAQGWANKERYYQGRAVDAAVQLPLALIGKMLKFIPSVFCIYFVPTIGAGLARLAFAGAAAIQQDKGFFSLGIGLGVLDAIIYLFGAAIVAVTVGAFVWAFSTVTFTGRILALFYSTVLAFGSFTIGKRMQAGRRPVRGSSASCFPASSKALLFGTATAEQA